MVAACLTEDETPVPARLVEIIGERADGMPFLVEELLAGLINRGSLVESAPGWELHGEPDAMDVPLSFSQTVRERLAELADDERRVVESAALLGRDFDWLHLPLIVPASEGEVLEVLPYHPHRVRVASSA